MRNTLRCICALLIASFAWAPRVYAQEEEGQDEASVFVRTGFYVGVGGTAAFPQGWDDDFIDQDLNDKLTNLANENALANLTEIAPGPPPPEINKLFVTADGADLEDVLMGVSGLIGYRAGDLVAFELEAEWLIDSNETDLDIEGSTGSHKVEVEKIWSITANVKVYPPLTGRIQPFGKFGMGLLHSKLDRDIVTSGLTTTNIPPPMQPTLVVSADLRTTSTTNFDGVLRVGGGIDIYTTPNIVVELGVSWVLPFSEVGSMTTDYVAVQSRVIYRF